MKSKSIKAIKILVSFICGLFAGKFIVNLIFLILKLN